MSSNTWLRDTLLAPDLWADGVRVHARARRDSDWETEQCPVCGAGAGLSDDTGPTPHTTRTYGAGNIHLLTIVFTILLHMS